MTKIGIVASVLRLVADSRLGVRMFVLTGIALTSVVVGLFLILFLQERGVICQLPYSFWRGAGMVIDYVFYGEVVSAFVAILIPLGCVAIGHKKESVIGLRAFVRVFMIMLAVHAFLFALFIPVAMVVDYATRH